MPNHSQKHCRQCRRASSGNTKSFSLGWKGEICQVILGRRSRRHKKTDRFSIVCLVNLGINVCFGAAWEKLHTSIMMSAHTFPWNQTWSNLFRFFSGGLTKCLDINVVIETQNTFSPFPQRQWPNIYNTASSRSRKTWQMSAFACWLTVIGPPASQLCSDAWWAQPQQVQPIDPTLYYFHTTDRYGAAARCLEVSIGEQRADIPRDQSLHFVFALI